jgi:sugar lactone lactonase YvrE
MRCALLVLTLLAAAAPLGAQTITTIAGNGQQGAGPDGILATESPLFMLQQTVAGLVFDRDGNLYFSESGANRVRRIDRKSGRIFTVAGTGELGYSGDGGPATAAKLREPGDLAFDPAGNLYVSDTGNNRVRRIDLKNGVIETFAGTGRSGYTKDGFPVAATPIGHPIGIAFDAAGNFFVMDPYASRLLGADAETRIVRTVVGDGTLTLRLDARKGTKTGLAVPSAIRVTSTGELVFSVSDCNSLLKVNPKTGDLTHIAGTLNIGLTGDGGPATRARLSQPTAIALDKSDNIWFVDWNNNVIRRIDAKTGIIETRVGSGRVNRWGETEMAGFDGDSGPAAKAQLNRPAGLGFDRDGNLYILDTMNNRIRKVEKAAP